MSEELKHAPGPWSIRQESVWSVGTDHEMTALVYGCTDKEEEANAHLIAAAPDLLEALKAISSNPCLTLDDLIYQVREVEGEGWEGPAVTAWSNACVAVKKAIAKAEGRAE